MTSVVIGVALTVVSVLGLLLNGYILVVIVLTKQVQAANNLLLLHLGVVDLLLCALFLLFSSPSLLRGTPGWLTFTAPCSLQGFLFTLLHPMALWTLCGLNCDRYFAISAPLHYGAVVSRRRVSMGLSVAWGLSFALALPPLFLAAPYRYSWGLGGCAPDFGLGDGSIWYSTVFTFLTLLVPAALILGCNIKVLMIARYHRHRIASAIFEVALSAQVTITHQRNPFSPPVLSAQGGPRFLRSRSAISTVLQLLGSFLLLYFPYYGVILWDSSVSLYTTDTRVHPHLATLASTLLACSPSVNALLYGVKSKVLRKTFQNYWRKQMSKSEMNQEIQARTPSACGSRRPSLSPLGILARPGGQRRLSEVFLDPYRGGTPKPRIQRIASEMNWRPVSAGTSLAAFSLLPRSRSFRDRVQTYTSSCNTLQVPPNYNEVSTIEDEDAKSFRAARESNPQGSLEGSTSLCAVTPQATRPVSFSSANLFVQRIFGAGSSHLQDSVKRAAAVQTVLANTPRRSPRILITRAFSEESESPPTPASPSKGPMGRLYSTSTNSLIERKWKRYRYQEAGVADGCSVSSGSESFRAQKLDVATTSVSSSACGEVNNSSCSSIEEDGDADDASEASSVGRAPSGSSVPLVCDLATLSDANSDDAPQESPPTYILSWPTRRKGGVLEGANGTVTSSTQPARIQVAHSLVDFSDAPEFVL